MHTQLTQDMVVLNHAWCAVFYFSHSENQCATPNWQSFCSTDTVI